MLSYLMGQSISTCKGHDMTFDPSKPVKTREGLKARILCVDRANGGDMPVIALITKADDTEHLYKCTLCGACYNSNLALSDPHTLVNIPEKGYINIWVLNSKIVCSSKGFKTAAEARKGPEGPIPCGVKYLHIALEVDMPND